MHVFACLLLCFRSMFVWLDLGSCCSLFPPWACACWSLGSLACVVASVLLVAYLDVTACKNTSSWCRFTWCIPFLCSVWCYACLACLVPPFGSLCFFASLHTCLHVHAWVLVCACVIKPSSCNLMWVHTRSWYKRPRVPLGILLDGVYVVHAPISWNYEHLIQTYICPPRTPPFVW